MGVYIQQVWTQQQSSQTQVLFSSIAESPTKLIEISTVGFSGTVDIRGSLDGNNLVNIPYILVGQAVIQNTTVDQLVYGVNTSLKRYLVMESYPILVLIMTRTAGEISCIAAGMEHPFLAFKRFVEVESMAILPASTLGRIVFDTTNNRPYIGVM